MMVVGLQPSLVDTSNTTDVSSLSGAQSMMLFAKKLCVVGVASQQHALIYRGLALVVRLQKGA
jgi:hypothetical protein